MSDRRLRVLALAPYSDEGASVRFRVVQFLPHLAAAGFDATIHPLFDTALFRMLYQPGHVIRKTTALIRRSLDRASTLRAGAYDLAFIHREAYPVGAPLIERWLAKKRVPIVFDFDDAIYLPNTSDANRMIGFMKNPGKVGEILRLSTEVIAGNPYLGDYARHHARSVNVVPTCVDTTVWVPRSSPRPPGPPVIGWIGTPTTTSYLRGLHGVLAEVARTHQFILRVSGAAGPVTMPGVAVENVPWSQAAELTLFNTCDIGVYPLPDNEWTLGKCGFKAIQFMSCGVPVVASPVGVNRDIVQHNVSGILAASDGEWMAALRGLIENEAERRRLGAGGRARIEERYSLAANAPAIVSVFERAAAGVHDSRA
ncbi:MAG: glycosyltransferase family 4 protein [Vicinamibacterales bacterium]